MTDQTRYGGAVGWVGPTGEYGFIWLPNGEKVFLHRDHVKSHTLKAGLQVTFCIIEGARGLRAVSVEAIAGPEDCAQAALAGLLKAG